MTIKTQDEMKVYLARLHSELGIPYSFMANKLQVSASMIKMFISGNRNLSEESFGKLQHLVALFKLNILNVV